MRKIISGKLYDTGTAKQLWMYEKGCAGDMEYLHEALYQTGRGNFFLHCKGGANSRYGESYGNETWGGSKIVVISRKDAFEWVCEKGCVAVAEEHFRDLFEPA